MTADEEHKVLRRTPGTRALCAALVMKQCKSRVENNASESRSRSSKMLHTVVIFFMLSSILYTSAVQQNLCSHTVNK